LKCSSNSSSISGLYCTVTVFHMRFFCKREREREREVSEARHAWRGRRMSRVSLIARTPRAHRRHYYRDSGVRRSRAVASTMRGLILSDYPDPWYESSVAGPGSTKKPDHAPSAIPSPPSTHPTAGTLIIIIPSFYVRSGSSCCPGDGCSRRGCRIGSAECRTRSSRGPSR